LLLLCPFMPATDVRIRDAEDGANFAIRQPISAGTPRRASIGPHRGAAIADFDAALRQVRAVVLAPSDDEERFFGEPRLQHQVGHVIAAWARQAVIRECRAARVRMAGDDNEMPLAVLEMLGEAADQRLRLRAAHPRRADIEGDDQMWLDLPAFLGHRRGNPGRVVMLDFAERMADAAHSFLQAVNRRLGIGGGALKLRELAVDGIQIRHGARLGGARERLELLAVLAAKMERLRDAVTGPLNEPSEGADLALHSGEA